MGRGGYLALEACGMVLAALATPTAIHGVLDRESEQWWGLLDQVPGGLAGRTVLLGLVAVLGIAYGGWAHLRLQSGTGRGAPSA
ncbi:hypothetical protein ACFW4X_05195 [Streptomyces smyrnaeus]|uniref:hypothetical protein n=1 Tax=Streptomyces smyrnaeus TaxID=1387713 RepID=UPI003410A8D8